jgi:hypothetical protein
LVEDFILCGLDELDLLAALLLERCDDRTDRLVLLRVEPLLPPHHEVGSPRAGRRQCQRGHQKNLLQP